MTGFFIFAIGFILCSIGSEDYHTRGGTDTPYPWEEAFTHYGIFIMIIGVLVMVL